MTPVRLLSVYNTAMTRWSTQDVLAQANGKCTLMGKGKDPSRNMMYPWKNKILTCMDFASITYFYNLAFSKHLPTYSLT